MNYVLILVLILQSNTVQYCMYSLEINGYTLN